jgi:anti-sigma factor ChrR (cupin superfamily)
MTLIGSIHDDAFWDHVPAEFLRTLVEQGRDNGLPTSIYALGDPHRLETPGVVFIKAHDRHHFPRHCHDCERFEIVLHGAFTDGTGRLFQAGDVMIAHHMDMYGPHIAEPGGYVVLEYFGSVLGTYELFWDTRRGPFKANKIEEDHAKHGADSPLKLPVAGTAPPPAANVERGASFQSIHDAAFWDHEPAPHLQPRADAARAAGVLGYRLFALGDPLDAGTPAVVVTKLSAGPTPASPPPDAHRLLVVVEGSLVDEDGAELSAGSLLTAAPGEGYGPLVVGKHGCVLAEFFSRLAAVEGGS